MSERDPKLEKEAVECFLWAQRGLTDLFKSGGNPDKETSNFDREIWALTHNARLFVLPPETYGRLYRAADIFTTETIGGLPWLPAQLGIVNGEFAELPIEMADTRMSDLPAMLGQVDAMICANLHGGESKKQTAVDSIHFMQAVNEAGYEVPVPERLPFDSIFVCYGGHILLGPGQRFIRKLDVNKTQDTCLIGHLIAYSKDEFKAYEVLRMGPNGTLVYYPIFHRQGWVNPMDLNPWVLNGVVALLMQHQKFVLEHPLSTGQRMKYRKLKRGKFLAPIPSPYYTVVLKDEVIDQIFKDSNESLHRRTFEYSYRFDVSGHERCKVRRGPLPLEPELSAKLEKLDYSIYTLGTMPPEHMERLGRRKLAPKKPDEWLAIKLTWVEDYQKGPDGTPYVPAVRVAVYTPQE